MLLLQAFEAALDLGTFLGVPRLLQGGLQFAEPVVDVLLPPRELLQPAEDLQLSLPFRRLRRLRGPLGFVMILRLGQVQLVHLPLTRRAALAL